MPLFLFCFVFLFLFIEIEAHPACHTLSGPRLHKIENEFSWGGEERF